MEKVDFSAYVLIFGRQRGRDSKGVVFTTTLIARSTFNPYPGHVVASLDKAFYDDYLCIVALNKQKIRKKFTGTLETPKQVRIRPSAKYSYCTVIKSVRIVQ